MCTAVHKVQYLFRGALCLENYGGVVLHIGTIIDSDQNWAETTAYGLLTRTYRIGSDQIGSRKNRIATRTAKNLRSGNKEEKEG